MECSEVKFSSYAIQRIFERKINKDAVVPAIRSGEIISEYPDDKPYPSYLILFLIKDKPIHVVVALDKAKKMCYIITVYEPGAKIWSRDFKTRRKQ